ncbi:MAG: MATE family efflux transporter [Bacteroidota bacterium]
MAPQSKATLTSGSIPQVLTRLTIPMIFGLFGMIAFNLVDAFFIGKLGTGEDSSALDALGFTMPVVLIMGAMGMGFSMGASAIIAKAIGEGNQTKVQRLTVDSLSLAFSFALLFVIVGLFTMDPVFMLLGAEGEVLELVKDYMRVWYIGVPFVIVPFVGNSSIRANGDTKTPAMIMMSMVGLNIILDPILIFGLGPVPSMGLEGAALATLISRLISLVLSVYVLKRMNMLTNRIPTLEEMLQSWKGVLHIGLPAAATNLVVPLTTALITNLVAQHGSAAVGALGVAAKIDLFAIMVVVALSSVMGPFVGQNIGAGQLDRLSKGVTLGEKFSIFWGLGMLVVIGLLGPWIAPIFSDNPKVVEVITLYLAIVPFGYAARCVYAIGNTILNVMDKPLLASTITLIQMFVVYLPMAYLGSSLFGLHGIFGAQALAFLVGGSVSYFLVMKTLRSMPEQMQLKTT